MTDGFADGTVIVIQAVITPGAPSTPKPLTDDEIIALILLMEA